MYHKRLGVGASGNSSTGSTGKVLLVPVKATHLAVVPLVVVLAVPPDVLLIGDVVADPSAIAYGKATGVDGVEFPRGRGWDMPP